MSFRKLVSFIAPLMIASLFLVSNTEAATPGSLVYVKNHNVWLSDSDGTNAHQVTRSGTEDSPWRSPSQADDGTIAASFGTRIVRLEQNGEVLSSIDPPPLSNSVSHMQDGVPVDVAISPDGKVIAWTYYTYECPIGVDCGGRYVTGYTDADKASPETKYGHTYYMQPSWVGNKRTLQSGGYGSHVMVDELGAGDPVHWFDDSDYAADSTDLGDAELSRDGKRIAAVRGYGNGTHIIWFKVNGNALSGPPPAVPEPECLTGELGGLSGPTWAPDGQTLAWTEPDGVWVKSTPGTCDSPQPKLMIPGASEPDFGPAANDPKPVRKFKVRLVNTTLAKALKKGMTAKVSGAKPGKVSFSLKKAGKPVGSGKATAGKSGSATVKATFTKKARKALKKVSRLKLTAKVNAGDDVAKFIVTFKG